MALFKSILILILVFAILQSTSAEKRRNPKRRNKSIEEIARSGDEGDRPEKDDKNEEDRDEKGSDEGSANHDDIRTDVVDNFDEPEVSNKDDENEDELDKEDNDVNIKGKDNEDDDGYYDETEKPEEKDEPLVNDDVVNKMSMSKELDGYDPDYDGLDEQIPEDLDDSVKDGRDDISEDENKSKKGPADKEDEDDRTEEEEDDEDQPVDKDEESSDKSQDEPDEGPESSNKSHSQESFIIPETKEAPPRSPEVLEQTPPPQQQNSETGCYDNQDCSEGQVCKDGNCKKAPLKTGPRTGDMNALTPSQKHPPCMVDDTCKNLLGPDGRCGPKKRCYEAKPCKTTHECSDGFICRSVRVIKILKKRVDAKKAIAAESFLGTKPQVCQISSECGKGRICLMHHCRHPSKPCKTDYDCPIALDCRRGRCTKSKVLNPGHRAGRGTKRGINRRGGNRRIRHSGPVIRGKRMASESGTKKRRRIAVKSKRRNTKRKQQKEEKRNTSIDDADEHDERKDDEDEQEEDEHEHDERKDDEDEHEEDEHEERNNGDEEPKNEEHRGDDGPDDVTRENPDGDVSDISASDIESEQGGDTDSISMNTDDDNTSGSSNGSNQVDNQIADIKKTRIEEKSPVQDETTTESNPGVPWSTPEPESSNPTVDDERQRVCVRRNAILPGRLTRDRPSLVARPRKQRPGAPCVKKALADLKRMQIDDVRVKVEAYKMLNRIFKRSLLKTSAALSARRFGQSSGVMNFVTPPPVPPRLRQIGNRRKIQRNRLRALRNIPALMTYP